LYKIAFLLLPEFQMLGFINAIEALRVANSLFPEPKFDVRIVHDDTDIVPSSGSIPVVATHGHVSTQHDADSLVISCSFHHDQYLRDNTQSLIRRFDRHGMRLGCMESGVYHLARAGVLNGHSVTAHFNNFPLFAQLFPEVRFVRQVFTFNPTRMSAAGGTSCLDMILALIQEQLGTDVEARVANMLIHPYRRESATFLDDMFTSGHSGLPLVVRDCCKVMEQHMDPPLPLEEIAAKLSVSRRQLDRVFHQTMHSTAAEHYRLIRLARARN
jgi:AraC family carnitine catabolism transcriptional activator